MSILVATPAYGGMMTEPHVAAREFLRKELLAAGVEHDFLTIRNESLITRARDVLAASFLYDTDFSVLLFIDADIESGPADVALLWNLCYDGHDVAVGPYCHKRAGAERQAWVGGQLRPVSDFKEPFQVDYAGTGFMMIRRETFERLRKAHPDWKYEEGFPLEGKKEIETRECWAFFQDPIEDSPLGRFKLSEDYFFVSRVRELGMRVTMHPDIHLSHWGQYPY